jgi:hypothetical protein
MMKLVDCCLFNIFFIAISVITFIRVFIRAIVLIELDFLLHITHFDLRRPQW